MGMEEMDAATTCSKCNESLEGRQRIGMFGIDDGKLRRVICDSCDAHEKYDNFAKTGRLTTSLASTATLEKYDLDRGRRAPRYFSREEINALSVAVDRLNTLTPEIDAKIWEAGGLGVYLRKEETRGFECKCGETELLTYSIAGRCMLTLRRGGGDLGSYISFVCAEDEAPSRMGWQGVDATPEEATAMVREVVEKFNLLCVWPNHNVRLLGT